MTQQGWECPKCGRVYAPFMTQCTACPQPIETAAATTFVLRGCQHEWATDTGGTRCLKCGERPSKHDGDWP